MPCDLDWGYDRQCNTLVSPHLLLTAYLLEDAMLSDRLAAMLLLYKSFAVTTGATSRRDVWQPVGLLLTVILLMTGLLAFILPRYA